MIKRLFVVFVLVFNLAIANVFAIDQKDLEISRTVRELTDQSSERVTQTKLKNGGILFDFGGGFQNVALSRIDEKGESKIGCVTSAEEANLFFERNLETGLPVPNDFYRTESLDEIAKRHGMTTREFVFYQKLISDSELRLLNPNASTISIVNNDGAGEGFNDPTPVAPIGGNSGTTLGQQRLNLFTFAANIWSNFLDSNVPILVRSQFNPLTCTATSAVLGSAGPLNGTVDHPNAVFPGTIYHIALGNKQSGVDNDAANPDISATFNSNLDGTAGCLGGRTFYLGTDNPMPTPGNTTNLLVVLLHELGHGLGFSSFGVNSTTGAFNNGIPDTYTTFTFDQSTNLFWNAMTNGERLTSITNTNNVVWTGPNVSIASSFLTVGRNPANGRVQLFTPNPFQGGSSVSHFNNASFPNLLMEPAINSDLPVTLDLTRQQMRDIGWYRDTTADVVPDTITSVSPNSSAVTIGQVHPIFWTNTGGFTRNVIIELSTDGGVTFPTVIASNVTNSFAGNFAPTATFNWTVPNTPTTTARIRVREDNFSSPSAVSSGNFTIGVAPTAATASINGRVLTSAGRGVSRATVTITDPEGQVRYSTTNSFGYYRFDNLATGQNYVISAGSKRYQFGNAIQSVFVGEDLTGVDFTALP